VKLTARATVNIGEVLNRQPGLGVETDFERIGTTPRPF
jgi:hypothetical protein